MTASPFFSVIIPVHNRETMVARAIQSVLDQVFDNFEVIIVDDGSSDKTAEVIQRFQDPRIKYFYKENEERSIARNFGVQRSSGAYVNFLDSDDYFQIHHLQTAHDHIHKLKFPELLHFGFQIRDARDGKLLNEVVPTDFDNRALMSRNDLCCNSFFIRREVLRDINFLHDRDAVISEDWYLWIRLAARYKIHAVGIVTNVVAEHPGRSLRATSPEKFENSLLKIIDALHRDPMVARYFGSGFSSFLTESYSLISLQYVRYSKSKALKYLWLALQARPSFLFRRRCLAIIKNLIAGFVVE